MKPTNSQLRDELTSQLLVKAVKTKSLTKKAILIKLLQWLKR
ncbi:hypothetical protein [Limosilactobacillus fermentum]|nr:hypothetical protein [Limosilactobacillus fermentum]WCE95565.1 hypothetical protein PMF18_06050 [Limosilactobacillus fermentum]